MALLALVMHEDSKGTYIIIWSAATRLDSALKLTRPDPPIVRRGNRASRNLFHLPIAGPEAALVIRSTAAKEIMLTDRGTEHEESQCAYDVVLMWMTVLVVRELQPSQQSEQMECCVDTH